MTVVSLLCKSHPFETILCIYCRCTQFFFFFSVLRRYCSRLVCDLDALVKKRLQSFDSFAKIYIYVHTSETDWCDWKKNSSQFVPPDWNIFCRLEDGTDPNYFHNFIYLFARFSSLSSNCVIFPDVAQGWRGRRRWEVGFLKVNEKQLPTEPNFLN